ncbi:MarR family winged helix-turn-helix transcriptional regulator [Paenibacillus chartarius]|uniref:MarR family winged helix-turn-helix transcriptional regulator n=1 Tax=Paenibacillus chartarius TaxID=747481 RepID=A0ABV6DHU4_9BACL
MDTLTPRFHSAFQELRRGVETEMFKKMESTITAPQMYTLYYISTREQCRLSELAEKLEVKPSAVTVMIDRLEKAGFVTRVDDPADRRAILVKITDPGKEVMDRAIEVRNHIVGSYLSRLKPEEAELITTLLEKMVTKTS